MIERRLIGLMLLSFTTAYYADLWPRRTRKHRKDWHFRESERLHLFVNCSHIILVIRAGITAASDRHAPHAELHSAIVDAAIDTGGEVDAVTLAAHLHERHRPDKVGGTEHLVTILEAVRSSDRIGDLLPLLRS